MENTKIKKATPSISRKPIRGKRLEGAISSSSDSLQKTHTAVPSTFFVPHFGQIFMVHSFQSMKK
jgi:hypothetical protein